MTKRDQATELLRKGGTSGRWRKEDEGSEGHETSGTLWSTHSKHKRTHTRSPSNIAALPAGRVSGQMLRDREIEKEASTRKSN